MSSQESVQHFQRPKSSYHLFNQGQTILLLTSQIQTTAYLSNPPSLFPEALSAGGTPWSKGQPTLLLPHEGHVYSTEDAETRLSAMPQAEAIGLTH